MKNLFYLILFIVLLGGCVSPKQADSEEVDSTQITSGNYPEEQEENYTLSNPPLMNLTYGDAIHVCSNGTTSWYNFEADADGDYWNGLYEDQLLELTDIERIDIGFEVMPDNISIRRRWKDSTETKLVSTSDFYIIVPKDEDEIIYEIKSEWPEGYAYYVFRIKVGKL